MTTSMSPGSVPARLHRDKTGAQSKLSHLTVTQVATMELWVHFIPKDQDLNLLDCQAFILESWPPTSSPLVSEGITHLVPNPWIDNGAQQIGEDNAGHHDDRDCFIHQGGSARF